MVNQSMQYSSIHVCCNKITIIVNKDISFVEILILMNHKNVYFLLPVVTVSKPHNMLFACPRCPILRSDIILWRVYRRNYMDERITHT